MSSTSTYIACAAAAGLCSPRRQPSCCLWALSGMPRGRTRCGNPTTSWRTTKRRDDAWSSSSSDEVAGAGAGSTTISSKKLDLDDDEALRLAQDLFHVCRRALADSSVVKGSAKQDANEKIFQLGWDSMCKVVEMELSLMYEALYTKAIVLHAWPTVGYPHPSAVARRHRCRRVPLQPVLYGPQQPPHVVDVDDPGRRQRQGIFSHGHLPLAGLCLGHGRGVAAESPWVDLDGRRPQGQGGGVAMVVTLAPPLLAVQREMAPPPPRRGVPGGRCSGSSSAAAAIATTTMTIHQLLAAGHGRGPSGSTTCCALGQRSMASGILLYRPPSSACLACCGCGFRTPGLLGHGLERHWPRLSIGSARFLLTCGSIILI